MEKTRRGDMDFIKGILMFCVVWGHICAYLIDNSNYSGKSLTCYTTLFQMPLFLFVSGFFQKKISTWTEFKTRTTQGLMRSGIPYLTYSFIAFVLISIKRMYDGAFTIDFQDIRGIGSVYWYFITLIIFLFFNNLSYMIEKKGGG